MTTDAATLVLQSRDRALRGRIVHVTKHVLYLDFDHADRMEQMSEFPAAQIEMGEHSIPLGRARYYPHVAHPLRRAEDPKDQPGDGILTTLDEVFDFDKLLKKGLISSLAQQLEQLPLVWNRRNGIKPEFAGLVAETVYDLNVLRSVFDDIDHDLQRFDQRIANAVRETVVRTRYQDFESVFDDKLRRLEQTVSGLSAEEHEQHGFYLRKQVWDLILASAFMARTNLKPRGYAGDSEMMRMIYEQAYIGPTIFSRFLHYHPIKSHAAQAVRNRIQLLGQVIKETIDRRGDGARVMSVACGPARELRHALSDVQHVKMVQLTLLDQDADALAEAASELQLIHNRFGFRPNVRYEQESVRRMLAAADLNERLGGQHLIYSMGLFDYLTAPVARAVLTKLYELLAEGGELVIGNYHVGNPTRIYMEYWMDWVLFYRSEDDFVALCSELKNATVKVVFEETASQMFLRVTKNG